MVVKVIVIIFSSSSGRRSQKPVLKGKLKVSAELDSLRMLET